MKKTRVALAILLALSMLLGLVACSGTQSPNTSGDTTQSPSTSESPTPSDSQSPKEPVRITLYPSAANLSSGVVGGYKGDYFKSLGFEVDVWAYSDEKTNAILTSGDLPDVMYIPDVSRDVMIESGMLLNLDDYLDQMPNLTAYQPAEAMMRYVREFKSAGTGGLYGLATSVGDGATKYAYADSTERNAVKLRWDVYTEIGAPEITDIWNLIDVMEQMLKAYPVDEQGIPFYGTILNNGSDTSYWACMTMFYRWQGYLENQLPFLLESDMIKGQFKSILDPDSLYYQGLKWYYEVNRRGLMDPESINNDRATQKVKADNGYAMVPSGYLPGWSPTYLEAYVPNTTAYYKYSSTYGDSRFMIGINAKTQNLEAALAFVDMLCSPDAHLVMRSGPDGGFWETDENGVATLTARAVEYLEENGKEQGFALESGEELVLWNTPHIVNTGALTSYTAPDGSPRIALTTQWPEVEQVKASSDSVKSWQATTGYENWQALVTEKNAFRSTSSLDDINTFCSDPDDNMKLIIDALRDKIVTASWQMVYATSESEFENIWAQLLKDCEGLGAQDIIDWRLADIEKAKAIRDSLGK